MIGPILVTGPDGFIGSHVVSRALAERMGVRCFRRDGNANSSANDAEYRLGDICQLPSVLDAMRGVATVFHTAAIVSVNAAQACSDTAVQVNTVGTYNVLEAARRCGVRRVVVLSSAHVYGSPQFLPITEDHVHAPASIYAATKLAADDLALTYHRCFGLEVNILRPFNVYGPRQVGAVVPIIVSQAVRGGPIHVEDLRPKRDFVFVDDVVDAMFRAATTPVVGKEILLASGSPTSIAALVRAALSLTTGFDAILPMDPWDEGDCVFGSAARAQEILGWAPKTSLMDGLARTIAWWKVHMRTEFGQSAS